MARGMKQTLRLQLRRLQPLQSVARRQLCNGLLLGLLAFAFCGVAPGMLKAAPITKAATPVAPPAVALAARSGASQVSATNNENAQKSAVASRSISLPSQKSSTRSPIVDWLRSHPQFALFAGAVGVVALAVGLVALTRPPRVVEEAPPPVGESDDVERLQMLLEFEQAARKENEVLFWKMAMYAGEALHIMHPREATIQWFGGIDSMLGYSQNSFPRTVEGWAAHIHPDESEKIVALYMMACRKKEEFRAEYRMRHRNGTYRDWSHRGRPVFDDRRRVISFVGACSDVTERNRAQHEMRETEERLERVLESNPAAMLLCDLSGRITLANRAAEQIFGCESGTLTDQPYAGGSWNVVDRDGAALLEEQMPHALIVAKNAPLENLEHAVERGNGEVVLVSVSGTPLHDASGSVNGTALFLSDIPERIEHESQTSHDGLYDGLTGLAKRALFHDRLEHALQRAANTGTRIAVLLIDEETWKNRDNDLGEGAGEELLQIVSQRLDGSLRVFDTAARLDGGQFAVLVEDTPELENAQIVVDRVLEALQKPVVLRGEEVLATPRLGAALSRSQCAPTEIMNWAAEALAVARAQQDDVRFAWHETSALADDALPDTEEDAGRDVEGESHQTVEARSRNEVTPDGAALNGVAGSGISKVAPGLAGAEFYFSTHIPSDVVSDAITTDGTLAPGLAVHRVTPEGVLVEEAPSVEDDDSSFFAHSAANGHVIKNLPLHELKSVDSSPEDSAELPREKRGDKIPEEQTLNAPSESDHANEPLLRQA